MNNWYIRLIPGCGSQRSTVYLTRDSNLDKAADIEDWEQAIVQAVDQILEWLKIKTEASGWPSELHDGGEGRFYREVRGNRGNPVRVRQSEAEPGLKATAKLMLNSFWGKFDQRENLPQIEQCTTPQELFNMTEDDTNQVQELRFCSEDVLEVVYRNKEDAVVPSNKTIVFVCWSELWTARRCTRNRWEVPWALSFGSAWNPRDGADIGATSWTTPNSTLC